ncbi:ferredoxin [Acrocarpospora catenulata]|uniref:ferredoxin n=1 Tax=Acrocarpospora catenulata TaxID=2836182 RepID=UPI001BD91BC7|nr:ferredoxin [Acrocarpospora catenulata]
MHVVVDLRRCDNHGQCTFSAPAVFTLNQDGLLSFRRSGLDSYASESLDEDLRADVEEAALMCPMQAIMVES